MRARLRGHREWREIRAHRLERTARDIAVWRHGVVWRLDRFLNGLIYQVERLDATSVGLRCLQESIDTESIRGRFVFHLFGALAEFERNLTRERTRAGLSAARARGHTGGRWKRRDPGREQLAMPLCRERWHAVEEICRLMGIGRSTLYSYLTAAERNAQRAA
jgi:DNA invertase Pin-like site-specific DNA recombinase